MTTSRYRRGAGAPERVRFFPRQLLTADDMLTEQEYGIEKLRRHNRYLHGWGVVCGLQVACSDCEGFVTVKSGYAIDPCGNDIIVSADQEFDVLQAISQCRDQARRQSPNCTPVRVGAASANCQDVEQTWCLTLSYLEQEARPITALRRDPPPKCGCRCNGSGNRKGCNCGCHSGSVTGSTTKSAGSTSTTLTSGVGTTIGVCEPTRIFEGFNLELCEADDNSCAHTPDIRKLFTRGGDNIGGVSTAGLAGILEGVGKAGIITDDSLLGKIIACLRRVLLSLLGRVRPSSFATLAPVLLANSETSEGAFAAASEQYDAFCTLHHAIRSLFLEDPPNTRCALVSTLNKIDCPPVGVQDTPALYARTIREPLYNLAGLVVQYVLDCVCESLMPPCPPDPGDNRVTLACITIKNDKILRICNFACRRYAGSFPATYYWLSAIPIIPLIKYFVQLLCCMPDLVRANSPLVNDLLELIDNLDPSGTLRQAMVEGNFALPKVLATRANDIVASVTTPDLAERLQPKGVNLATLVGLPPDLATKKLTDVGVQAVVHESQSPAEIATVKNLIAAPFAAKGDRVVLYKVGATIIGYGPYDPATEIQQEQADIAKLRQEIDRLRRQQVEVATVRRELADVELWQAELQAALAALAELQRRQEEWERMREEVTEFQRHQEEIQRRLAEFQEQVEEMVRLREEQQASRVLQAESEQLRENQERGQVEDDLRAQLEEIARLREESQVFGALQAEIQELRQAQAQADSDRAELSHLREQAGEVTTLREALAELRGQVASLQSAQPSEGSPATGEAGRKPRSRPRNRKPPRSE